MSNQRDLFGVNSTPLDEPVDAVTLTLVMYGEVGDAIKVSVGDHGIQFLLPRSKVKIVPTGITTHQPGHPKYAIVDVTMPLWLAKDRELI
jgi:hypothetical protein